MLALLLAATALWYYQFSAAKSSLCLFLLRISLRLVNTLEAGATSASVVVVPMLQSNGSFRLNLSPAHTH
uniref:Putative secreted protein n=1 Tax=Anopheles marajoara TaxID=58244 RepID=A0A2M4CFK5_9DIPT